MSWFVCLLLATGEPEAATAKPYAMLRDGVARGEPWDDEYSTVRTCIVALRLRPDCTVSGRLS